MLDWKRHFGRPLNAETLWTTLRSRRNCETLYKSQVLEEPAGGCRLKMAFACDCRKDHSLNSKLNSIQSGEESLSRERLLVGSRNFGAGRMKNRRHSGTIATINFWSSNRWSFTINIYFEVYYEVYYEVYQKSPTMKSTMKSTIRPTINTTNSPIWIPNIKVFSNSSLLAAAIVRSENYPPQAAPRRATLLEISLAIT